MFVPCEGCCVLADDPVLYFVELAIVDSLSLSLSNLLCISCVSVNARRCPSSCCI